MNDRQKDTVIVVLIMLFIGSIMISIDHWKKFKEYDNTLKLEKKIMSEALATIYKYSCYSIDKNCSLTSSSGDKVIIDEITKKDKLVVFISDGVCQVCINKLIFELRNVSKILKNNDVIVFGNFSSIREMLLLKQTYPYFSEIYNVKGSSLEYLFTDVTSPVMFCMDYQLTTKCLYIADKEISPYMTSIYLKTISERFFED